MCNQCYGPSRVLIGELENIISGEYDLPPAPPAASASALSWRRLPLAIAGNRQSSRDLHWSCIVGGKVRVSPRLLTLLGLPSHPLPNGSVPDDTLPDEKALANAVAGYQTRKSLEATGIIDAQTWGVMQKDMPL